MKTDFKQEIFDKVAKHLLTQKVKCTDKYGCCAYYDVETNTKCAAGCLIPDKDYSKKFERQNVGSFIFNEVTEFFRDSGYSENELDLISKLQAVHDQCECSSWRDKLKLLAKSCFLSDKILESF